MFKSKESNTEFQTAMRKAGMWRLLLSNIEISMLLQTFLIASIVPRVLFKSLIIVVNLVIELVEGLNAMLKIVEALLGAIEGYIGDITFVATLRIKGALVSRERHSFQIIDRAVQQLQ